MAELRSSIFIDQLQPQTMCYLGTWIRGSLPRTRMAAGSSRSRRASTSSRSPTSCSSTPRSRPGSSSSSASSATSRFHSRSTSAVESASQAVLDGARRRAARRDAAEDPGGEADLAPRPPARVPDQPQQARARWRCRASRCSCSRCSPPPTPSRPSTRPRRPREIKVVDYRMIGATGRVYLSGAEADVRTAADAATASAGGRRDDRAPHARTRCAKPTERVTSCCRTSSGRARQRPQHRDDHSDGNGHSDGSNGHSARRARSGAVERRAARVDRPEPAANPDPDPVALVPAPPVAAVLRPSTWTGRPYRASSSA